MAKNESSKSKAELYREERKERIAKAAKKNNKSVKSRNVAADLVKKIVAVVVAVAIVGGIAWKIVDSFGIAEKNTTVLTVGDMEVSATEYNYYYKQSYSSLSSMEAYYSQSGYAYTGFDFSVDPAKSTNGQVDEDGNPIYLDDFLKEYTLDSIQQIYSLYQEAQKNNFTLSEEDLSEIETQIQDAKKAASENNYSLNAYLRASYTNGLNEKSMRKIFEIQTLASKYYDAKTTEIKESVTEEDAAAEFKANPNDYKNVDVSYYLFAYTKLEKESNAETDEQLKAKQDAENAKIDAEAKGVFDLVTDEASLNKAIGEYEASKKENVEYDETEKYADVLDSSSYSEIKTAISEDASKWVYDSARKVGDKTLLTTDKGAYIIFMNALPYERASVDVRHILVKFNEKTSGKPTDEEKMAASEKANKILDEFNALAADKKTEKAFADLAKEHSEDTGSAENGGLIAGITSNGQYVKNFEAWSMDKARKAGDTGIVETEYGYHIMYFAKNNGPAWKTEILETLQTEAANEHFTALEAEDGEYAIVEKEGKIDKYSEKMCKEIAKSLLYNSTSAK